MSIATVVRNYSGFGGQVLAWTSRPFAVKFEGEILRSVKSGRRRTFGSRKAAQKVADQINLDNRKTWKSIEVESATTELIAIGPAHPDYKG